MKEIVGTTNKILEVNLSTRKFETFFISEKDRKLYIGGKGLGLKLLRSRLKPGIDPLGGENYLVFMMGVLMGTGVPCSGRFAALTKSPLTNIMLSCSCGGPFGMAFKSCGYDGLFVTGKSKELVSLVIDGSDIRFEDASGLRGKDTFEVQSEFNMGKNDGALVIGPAGENLVRFANIASGHRFLGRGGMGAVMGSKNLKAIIARNGQYKIVPENLEKFKKYRKKGIKYINSNSFTTQFYRKYGTSSSVNFSNKNCLLPVNNFKDGTHEKAHLISGETMKEKYNTEPSTCRPCSIICGHRGIYPDGTKHQIPEYETIGLLGSNLGIFDPELITTWNDLCGKLGLDTISTGSTLSYLIEAGEKGYLDTDLRYGSPGGIEKTIKDIAFKRGFGDELANGTKWLADKYGGKDFAINVKGLDIPAYDPRGAWGQGLTYAVANRGGCHLSAYLYALEILFSFLKPCTIRAKAEFVKALESITCGINSLHVCQFTMYAYTLESPVTRYTPDFLLSFLMQNLPGIAIALLDYSMYPKLWSAVTGIKMSKKEFLKAGDRIHVLERYMNTLEGISSKDDVLPERFTGETMPGDKNKRTIPIEKLVKKYYRLRGYDENGIPRKELLDELEIEI